VKAFVPVQIRLVTPISMGRQLQVILHATGRPLAMRERSGEGPGRVRIPQWRSPSCGTTCPSIFAGDALRCAPGAEPHPWSVCNGCIASRLVP
jgi:hypothetical protein